MKLAVSDEGSRGQRDFMVTGSVNGQTVTVLRDTGCTTAVVKQSLVTHANFTGEHRKYVLMDGTVRCAPIAKVEVCTPFYNGILSALVVRNPVADLIIGNIDGAVVVPVDNELTMVSVGAVKTRSISKSSVGDEVTSQKSSTFDSVVESVEDESTTKKLSTFDKCEENPLIKLTSKEIQQLQRGDDSLKSMFDRVVKDTPEDCDVWFEVRDGLLFRRKKGRYGQSTVDQLIAPKQHRLQIMQIAHEGVFGGHLGVQKTTDKVLQSFFWPGVTADIQRFCRSCDACQKTSCRGRVKKVPLITTPLIEEPFARVAVDIVGPLPRTNSGKKYILTMVDYATRFPDAIALSGISAEQVSDGLIEFFSRLGIPKEILSDQGTQFTSELMREVSKLLQSRQIFTTPYHAMSNGLCEKFNGTLKSCLRRVAYKEPKSWDKHIAPLLFAYRETPQASTGFSPFELVFGHRVKGPLTILKDLWSGEVSADVRSTYEYVIDMRERLQDAVELANEHLSEAKSRQKKYYDRGAKQRKFKEGDKVLILLPSETSKLKMAWKGPYVILERVSQVDYAISIKGKRRVYHANMLKAYITRPQDTDTCLSAAVVVDEEDAENHEPPMSLCESALQLKQTEDWQNVVVCKTLNHTQENEIKGLLMQYKDVLSDVPGKTNLITHKIELLDAKPVKVKQRTIPYATREAVKMEIDEMLKSGIIEPSDSPYSSPIVMVKKPAGGWRLCNDYRKVNAISKDDAEPMPEIEHIMSNLAGSKHFSKIDLTKGFWQVPLEEETKKITAFSTPDGLFQYTTLPFGLKGSPATFNRLMRKVLKGCPPGIEVFVDDILVHSQTWQEHIRLLEEVLVRLRKAGLTARPSKTQIGNCEVEFLGHAIKEGIVRPQDTKIEALKNCERPTTKTQVKSFLGLAGYYRKFVPNFSSVTAPLSDLTKKSQGSKFTWGQAQESSFQTVKSILTSEPVLKMPDWSKEFVVQTDACNQGIGGALIQCHDNVRHVIMYVSRKLKPAEKNYSTIEKESLSIVYTLSKLEPYLYGRKFVLETDHAPLAWIRENPLQNSRITRWALALQPYDFRVENIKGKDALWADFLSRHPDAGST